MTAETRGNRYDLSAALGPRAAFGVGIRRAAIRLARAVLERAVFAHTITVVARPLRAAIEHHYRRELADIAPHFEAPIYLAQVRSPVRHRRAAVAPLLHYWLTGWRETRAPSRTFDPVHYRAEHLRGRKRDPLLDYVRSGAARGATRHRQEAASVTEPAITPTITSVLVFNHGRGGGSSRFLELMQANAQAEGRRMIALRPITVANHMVVADALPGAPLFDLSRTEGRTDLVAAARAAGVTSVLVNHVVDQEAFAFDAIPTVAAALDVPYDMVLHDYYPVCPRIDGVTGQGRFCGLVDPSACGSCVKAHGAEAIGVDPTVWRATYQRLLAGARRAIVPSADHAQRLAAALPGIVFEIAEPERDVGYPALSLPRLQPAEPLRLVMLGALNVPKGAGVVLGLADAAKRVAAPIELTLLGPTGFEGPLRRRGVHVHGRYHDADLATLLATAAPHAVLLPAIWPETWSFVLTHALKAGLPVIAFDIGAPAERLRRLGREDLILPLDLAHDAERLLARLMDVRTTWSRAS